MRILFIDWNSFGNEDIIYHLKKAGHKIVYIPFSNENNTRDNEQLQGEIIEKISSCLPIDFIFSFNYYPIVSQAAMISNVKYVSWVYDSPFIQLYTFSLENPCNYVFLFDKAVYLELVKKGFETVYYLPLAANVERYDSLPYVPSKIKRYHSSISFVGSLYSEKKNQLYNRLETVSNYTKGFLEALISCQKRIYGEFLLEKCLTEKVLTDMILSYPVTPSPDGFENVSWTYAHYFLARKTTEIERQEILSMLSQQYSIALYTKEPSPFLPQVDNRGEIDYYTQMPFVFKNSKINLNITLRSIQTGIPLRAMDIMGCGGFLLTNFQADFLDFFQPDIDFVYYEDYEDLIEKTNYYLTHEKERLQMAKKGYEKVKQYHNYPVRIEEIIHCVNS